MANYFVFRTDDYKWILDELQEGRLRQGWGRSDMRLPQCRSPSQSQIDEWCQRYRKQGFPGKISADDALKRYRILAVMLSIEPGDIIVVPKTPAPNFFYILEAAGAYEFDAAPRGDPHPGGDDFRHIIPVKKPKVVRYLANEDSKTVKQSFKWYRRALNNVWVEEVVQALQSLLRSRAVDVGAVHMFQ